MRRARYSKEKGLGISKKSDLTASKNIKVKHVADAIP